MMNAQSLASTFLNRCTELQGSMDGLNSNIVTMNRNIVQMNSLIIQHDGINRLVPLTPSQGWHIPHPLSFLAREFLDDMARASKFLDGAMALDGKFLDGGAMARASSTWNTNG